MNKRNVLLEFPWLDTLYHSIITPFLANKLSHALEISYITGSAEKELSFLITQRLLCQNSHAESSCNHCHSCMLFLSGAHPDFVSISITDGKNHILVDQIRNISDSVYQHAALKGNKVILITDATKMTESAANSLLKMLEEPPADTYFLLMRSNDEKLIPTLHSRCVSYHLKTPTLERSLSWLQSKNSDKTLSENEWASALLLSTLAPLEADALINHDVWMLRSDFYKKIDNSLKNNDIWLLHSFFMADSNQIHPMLNWFKTLISDAVKAKNKTGRFIYNRDSVPLVRYFSLFSIEVLFQINDVISDALTHLNAITGINQELVISQLLSHIDRLLFIAHIKSQD